MSMRARVTAATPFQITACVTLARSWNSWEPMPHPFLLQHAPPRQPSTPARPVACRRRDSSPVRHAASNRNGGIWRPLRREAARLGGGYAASPGALLVEVAVLDRDVIEFTKREVVGI